MAKDYPRSYRVADQIQRELSDLIRNELKDPRIPSSMTIAAVEVNKDLSIAKVFVSTFDINIDNETRQEAVNGLNQAAGYLRKLLSNAMRMRSVPQLRFEYDNVQEDATRLSSLIDDAVRSNTTSDDTSPEP